MIPGRVSGVKCQDPRVRLLPSSETKSSVWRKYQTYMGDMNSTRRLSGTFISKKKSIVQIMDVQTPYTPLLTPKHRGSTYVLVFLLFLIRTPV